MWSRVIWKELSGLSTLRKWNRTRFIHPFVSQEMGCYSTAASTLVKINADPNENPYCLTKQQKQFLTKGNSELENKLSEVQLNLFLRRQEGKFLPPALRIHDIEVLMSHNTGRGTEKFLRNLMKCVHGDEKKLLRKEERAESLVAVREERKARREASEHPWLDYELFQNALFLRIYKRDVSHLLDTNAAQALQFGQKVVIDCSFESHMDEKNIKHTAKQVLFCYVNNRENPRPFSLHLCNLDWDGRFMFYLHRFNPNFEKDAGIGLHSCAYTDVFERKSLVYLSPNARTTLKYDPNDVYILGGIVDLCEKPYTYKKAERDKIRSARLPLEQYLNWKQGPKGLCIHQCFNTLLDVKNTGDWSTALRENVPPRKHIS